MVCDRPVLFSGAPGEDASPERVTVVVGAGVAGLAVTLALARASAANSDGPGRRIVVVEHDATPLPADPDEAFGWRRVGAPQVRHSHALLARLRNLLRDRHPDVLTALFEAGATELRFLDHPPVGMVLDPEPADEDLVALACRRTTFEWVLRSSVARLTGVELLDGVGVRSLVADPGTPPRVTGVRLDDGRSLGASEVIWAGGRRARLPELLAGVGVTIPEEVEDTGIVYLSRFFRLEPGAEYPTHAGPVGADLGYLKYGVFQGDDRTFSVTLSVAVADGELRKLLSQPENFIRAAALFPATAPYVEAGRARPITGVETMAGLLNRRRWFLGADGDPLVTGFFAVGDAHTCTNPLYGRGCSLAWLQAELLAEVLCNSTEGDERDPGASVQRYEVATNAEILPWYRSAVTQDRLGRTPSGSVSDPATQGDSEQTEDPDRFMAELVRDGLFPAMRTEPVVLRSFLRTLNLLQPPEALMADPAVVSAVMAAFQNRDRREPEPLLGPSRSALVDELGG